MQSRRQQILFTPQLIFLAATIGISSCSRLEQYPAPKEVATVELRSSFAAASAGNHEKISTNWLKSLHDENITKIVRLALANNPDLKVSAHRLRSAREGTIIGRASRLPSVTGSASSSLSRSDSDTSESYGLSLNASWEADLWGRLRDLENANYADYNAAVADFRSARLSLAINAAQSWCNLVTAEKQLTLSQQTLASYRKNFRIIERGYKAGILRPLEVNFGRNNIASAEQTLRSRQLARNEAARSLEVLLGTYPEAALSTAADLPDIPEQIRAGLPLELIERRPDLSARRARLLSSAKSASASQKSLLPDLRLTGSTGTSSSDLLKILDPAELASSIAASVSQSLYAGGELQARARQDITENEAQLDLYVGDVLNALLEVESALDTAQSLKDQEVFLEQESRQATLAERFAEGELIEGTADRSETQVLELLEAQRRADSARSSLISLRNQRIQNHLDLLLALGGSI